MSLKRDRNRVRNASANLVARRYKFWKRSESLQNDFEHWRPALLVGGGLIAGLLMGRGNLRDAGRSVKSAASFGMLLMRSTTGSLLLAKLFQRQPHSNAPTRQATKSEI